MSEHHATIEWQLGSGEFTYQKYPRSHDWSFAGGTRVRASAAPAFLGNPEHVDPEEAFVASIAACHMLTFLALAAKKRFEVESYTDNAVGVLEKDGDGKISITRVTLRPEIAFRTETPAAGALKDLHEQAHHHCFIANSVKTKIVVEGS